GSGVAVGGGIACVVEKAGTGAWEMARVGGDGAGDVGVYSGGASLGQGGGTIFAPICAEVLNVSIVDVPGVHGDTAPVPHGGGAFASRGTVVGGNAVLLAARTLREKVLNRAAGLLEVSRDDLVMEGGRVTVRGVPARALTFRDLADASYPTR